MARSTPIAYYTNPNTPEGYQRFGNLLVGTIQQDYSINPEGVRWWPSADIETYYVIGHVNINGNQPNPDNVQPTYVGFWRTEKTDEAFIQRVEFITIQDGDPQTFEDGVQAKTWLNNNGYWTSYSPKTPFDDLEVIAAYLRNFMPEYRNPDFYNYELDGNGFYINDGGGDMYDNGNISSPWLISGDQYTSTNGYDQSTYPFAVDYTQSATTQMTDTSFGYISLGYIQFNSSTDIQNPTYLPLTVLGSRDNQTYGSGLPVGFQTGGNSGADGGGQLASGYIYNGETVSGFTVYAYYRETYNAGDPSHCDLYILLGHPNWGSTFGTISSYAQPTNEGGCGGYLYTSGSGTENILSIKTLLSKNGGTLVDSSECESVVNNFIYRISEAVGFNGPIPTPSSTITPTPTITPTKTPTPTPTPSSTPFPPNSYLFYLADGSSLLAPTENGQLMFTDINQVIYNPNNAQEVVFSTIDKSGLSHPEYADLLVYGGSITLTQGSNTAILSGDNTLFAGYGTFYSGNYLTLDQASTNPFVSGEIIYLTVTVNYPTSTPSVTPTQTPTPTPSSLPPTSGFTVTVAEVGSDVVWSGSGSLNLTDLTLSFTQDLGSGYQSTDAIWAIGPNAPISCDFYELITTFPLTFGSGGIASTSGTGSTVGILPSGANRSLAVPQGYVSGTQISGSTTYVNQTISSMGLTPGTYVYSWGTGPNADSITFIIQS